MERAYPCRLQLEESPSSLANDSTPYRVNAAPSVLFSLWDMSYEEEAIRNGKGEGKEESDQEIIKRKFSPEFENMSPMLFRGIRIIMKLQLSGSDTIR